MPSPWVTLGGPKIHKMTTNFFALGFFIKSFIKSQLFVILKGGVLSWALRLSFIRDRAFPKAARPLGAEPAPACGVERRSTPHAGLRPLAAEPAPACGVERRSTPHAGPRPLARHQRWGRKTQNQYKLKTASGIGRCFRTKGTLL